MNGRASTLRNICFAKLTSTPVLGLKLILFAQVNFSNTKHLNYFKNYKLVYTQITAYNNNYLTYYNGLLITPNHVGYKRDFQYTTIPIVDHM